MGEDGVKLFGRWTSSDAVRVEWALKLKGVEYKYGDEDIPHSMSTKLMKYNPVDKNMPLLVHAGTPIAGFSAIMEYIEEEWNDGYTLMPKDPYERALARFWAHFADDKVKPALSAVFSKVGEEQQKALKDVQEQLRILGEALNGNKFFGGETISFVDIMAGWLAYWVPMAEEVTGLTIVNQESLPAIREWFDAFMGLELVKETLEKLVAQNRERGELVLAWKF